MDIKLINVGFGNIVSASRIIAVVGPESAPIKRIIQEAREQNRLIDATYGRRTRAVIVTDSGHIILSAVQPETVAHRVDARSESGVHSDTTLDENESLYEMAGECDDLSITAKQLACCEEHSIESADQSSIEPSIEPLVEPSVDSSAEPSVESSVKLGAEIESAVESNMEGSHER